MGTFVCNMSRLAAHVLDSRVHQPRNTCSFRVPTSANLVICDVIVWSDTGRLLCTDVDAFSTFVERHYGVQLDLSEAEVMLYIKANMDEMRLEQQQQRLTRRP